MTALMITLSRAVEIGVEADAELDERRQPARRARCPAVGPVDPREALEQRALAGPVPADDAEELAARNPEETLSTACSSS